MGIFSSLLLQQEINGCCKEHMELSEESKSLGKSQKDLKVALTPEDNIEGALTPKNNIEVRSFL